MQYATTLSPSILYPDTPALPLPLPLLPTPEEIVYLSTLLNPAYLSAPTLAHLRTQFIETSQLLLANFLSTKVATELESLIAVEEKSLEEGRRVKVGGRWVDKILGHDAGEKEDEWSIIGPPHIQRFAALSAGLSTTSTSRLTVLLREIQALFISPQFRSVLAALTSLIPLSHTTQIRRFRPSLDYTLARGEPSTGEAKLDLGLNLTPIHRLSKVDAEKWEGGDKGGWELWLAGEDEGGDEATYGGAQKGHKDGADPQEEEDATLLAFEPGWNRLHLVLRDPGVLKFVKYVSAGAPGSRWDIGGEWDVGMVDEDEEE